MRRPRVSIGLLLGVVGLVAVDLALLNFCLNTNGVTPKFCVALEVAGMGNLLTVVAYRYCRTRSQASLFLRAFLVTGATIALIVLLSARLLPSARYSMPFEVGLGIVQDFYEATVYPYLKASPRRAQLEDVAGIVFMATTAALVALPQAIVVTATAWFCSTYKIVRRAGSVEHGGTG